MDSLPGWFGQGEFYVIIVTIWFFLISWIIVNFLKIGGNKLDIKKKILGFKHWNSKRKERKELRLLEG